MENELNIPLKEWMIVISSVIITISFFILTIVVNPWFILALFASIGIVALFLRDTYLSVWKFYRERESIQKIAQFETEYDEFHRGIFSLLEEYSNYLTTSKKNAIDKTLKSYKNQLRGFGRIWREETRHIEEKINRLENFVREYNTVYLKKHRQKYHSFFDGTEFNQSVQLNENQIRAILVNDDNNLVVAGPGSGKTRVLVDRVAFYVLKKEIPAEGILVMAYNRTAVAEIIERLKNIYGIQDVEVRTFHSLGFKIVNRFKDREEEIRVEENTTHVIRELIEIKKADDPIYQHLYIQYYSNISEFIAEEEENEERLRKMYSYQENKPYEALDGSRVKSVAEKEIANFFITHGINFVYEMKVDWCDKDESGREYHPDFYLPEFDTYLEHWGISKDFPNVYNPVIEDVPKYFKEMEWKKAQFRKYGKNLLETDYWDWKTGKLSKKLLDFVRQLWKIQNREAAPLSHQEIIKRIDNLPHRLKILSDMIHTTIMDAKIYGYNSTTLSTHLRNKKLHRKDHAFLTLVFPIFEAYEDYLAAQGKIDYQDMINHAVQYLERPVTNEEAKEFCSYTMIFIDEFQDISFQRLRLLQELRKRGKECHMFFVGDDWQSIYGFSGASNKYMVKLDQFFFPVAQTILQLNYRNPPPIVNFSSTHINACSDYIPKDLVPVNRTDEPSMFLKRMYGGKRSFTQEQHDLIVDLIKKWIREGVDPKEIMILSRFNFGYSDLFDYCLKDKEIPVALMKEGEMVRNGIRFHSIHKAKGLEAEYVILMNVYKGLYGLPSELTSSFDHKLINPDLPDDLDEERRLFYVALTRAKKQVHIFAQLPNLSEFLDQIPTTREEFFANLTSNTGTYRIKGKIIRTSMDAICCEVKNDFQENIEIWLPKSVTRPSYGFEYGEEQTFYIQEWFVKNEQEDLHRKRELDNRYAKEKKKAERFLEDYKKYGGMRYED
ncbi:MAG: UvrD-helicase domain-containing protein [Candidatus Lokiarchaeota archaeon]|nr:UvrD-helicase domain-containing protein [Candidatus Lokiarchaeota archaeon]